MEAVEDRVVHVGNIGHGFLAAVDDLGDVQEHEALEQFRPAVCQVFRKVPAARLLQPFGHAGAVVAPEVVEQPGPHGIHQRLEFGHDLGDRTGRRALAEEPPDGAVQQPPDVQVDGAPVFGRERRRQFVEFLDHDVELVDLAEGHERLGDGGLRGRGFLDGTEREGDAAEVDHVVGNHCRDDLPAQRVGVQFGVEPLPQLLREVGPQRHAEPRVIGEVAVAQSGGKFDLGVGGQDRQLRGGQPLALFQALAQRVRGGQGLEVPLEVRRLFQPVHQPFVARAPFGDPHPVVEEKDVLVDVVLEHQPADLVGHGSQEVRTLGGLKLACRHHPVHEDLDVDLVVRAVDAGRVVDRVRVEDDALQRGLDASALGHPQVSAFPNHLDPQFAAVNADGVIGLVADLGIRFGAGLDVGADAAVVEQVGRGEEDGAQELRRAEFCGALREAEGGPDLRGHGDRLGLPGKDAAAFADERFVVVIPGGPGQFEEPLAFRVGRCLVRGGVEEDVPVVEGSQQADVLGEQHAVAEHVAGHVADAHHGEGLGLGVEVQFAEVALDRLPRAAGGDAHGLVVVADGAAGGEGVAEPEPVFAGQSVGDVGE
ncbi:hypothetical protein SRABI128_05320 [Microbacterium sp. Bi128]|nr:hypothetical protein SRABI128_05320 [Microbacterium sp. Bi128]